MTMGDEDARIVSCRTCPFESPVHDLHETAVGAMECPECGGNLKRGPHKKTEAVETDEKDESEPSRRSAVSKGECTGAPDERRRAATPGRERLNIPTGEERMGEFVKSFDTPPGLEEYRTAFIQLAGAIRGMDAQAEAETSVYHTGDKRIRARSRTLSAVRQIVDVYDPSTDHTFGDDDDSS